MVAVKHGTKVAGAGVDILAGIKKALSTESCAAVPGAELHQPLRALARDAPSAGLKFDSTAITDSDEQGIERIDGGGSTDLRGYGAPAVAD